jgi:glycosyltransferase involved in cell wall biosynthesis
MIVKNEEETIARALRSVKPVVDEMIVVDTGSTDRTKEIARSLGAKVYDFAWTDNFSDARNFSLSKATGEWILVLDADEVISALDHEKLRELIRQDSRSQGFKDSSSTPRPLESLTPAVVSFSFVTRNYTNSVSIVGWLPNDRSYPSEEAGTGWFGSEKVRLFPNDDRIRFENPVHELVENSLSHAGYSLNKSGIPVHHYGRLNTGDLSLKGEGYYELGKKKLAERGEQDIKALSELALQASELGKHEEAIGYWDKVTVLRPDIPEAFYYMGINYFHLERYKNALSCLKRAVQLDPESPEIIVVYSKYEICAGDAKNSILYTEPLLKKEPYNAKAMAALSTAYICEGRKDEGIAYLKKLREMGFICSQYLYEISKILVSAQRFNYAVSLLETATETNNATDETRVLLEECRKIQQGSRIRGVKDSSDWNPGTLESLAPVSFPGPLESSNPRTLSSGTLSLCMIVKNEEETIRRALLSVRPVVDEMIVVDTGSTDRTKDIARSLGAKVFDFQWTDNFSDARNFSLSKATGEWILVLDADEVISALDHEKLKQLIRQDSGIQGVKDSSDWDPRTLESSNPVAFSFVTRTYVEQLNTIGWVGNDGSYPAEEAGTGWFPGEKVRLFPNDGRIRFVYPLHERVEPSLIKAGIEIRTCDIPVHHYGNFVKKEKAYSKADLYYQLGKRKIADPGERNFMAYYEIGILGAELGKHEEALEYLKQAIALKPDFSKAYQSMGNIFYNIGNYEKALASYKRALELHPEPRDFRDTLLMCATCDTLTGNAEKAVTPMEDLLRNDPSYAQAMIVLAEAYICIGSKTKGLAEVKRLMALNFDCGSLFDTFAKMLTAAGQRDYALSILAAAREAGVATDETLKLLEEIHKK